MTSTVNLEEGLFINVQGTRTHYHDVGEGAPVLLLHGSGPGVSAWANWQHAIPSLAENSRVLALDIVGFGHTERPDDVRYSLRTWTDHVWNFLDAWESTRCRSSATHWAGVSHARWPRTTTLGSIASFSWVHPGSG